MERMQMITGAPPITASITHGLLPSPPEVFMETESPPDRTTSAAGEGDGEGKGEGELVRMEGGKVVSSQAGEEKGVVRRIFGFGVVGMCTV